jgi:peptidoglycan/LPS O-acetylase OafA/YrhL
MVVAWIDPADADQINYHFTFTRLDAMAWGVLLTLLLNDGRLGVAAINRHATLLVCGGAAAMLASMVHWTTYYEEVVKYTPQSLAIAIFFAGFILSDRYEFARKILEYEPVRHLGKISYEIYLWHFPTLTVLSYFIGNRIVALCAAIVCTIAIADLAYRLTTARLAPLRRKFGGHPANPVTGDNLRHPGTFS